MGCLPFELCDSTASGKSTLRDAMLKPPNEFRRRGGMVTPQAVQIAQNCGREDAGVVHEQIESRCLEECRRYNYGGALNAECFEH